MNEEGTAMKEMPRYKCHKEVYALKIAALEVHEDGTCSIQPADEGFGAFKADSDWVSRFHGTSDDPGYYVVYRDGYKSWSPTKAFEEGYTRI